jgi:acyl carrier protein
LAETNKIIESVYRAVDEVNELQPSGVNLEKSLKTALFGDGAILDSLGLVGLIVAVEEQIQDEFGVAVTLADERALSQSQSPFLTIGTLVDYVNMLISEGDDG